MQTVLLRIGLMLGVAVGALGVALWSHDSASAGIDAFAGDCWVSVTDETTSPPITSYFDGLGTYFYNDFFGAGACVGQRTEGPQHTGVYPVLAPTYVELYLFLGESATVFWLEFNPAYLPLQ